LQLDTFLPAVRSTSGPVFDMLKQNSYIEYLESITLSLIDTFNGEEFPITDPDAGPSLAGFSASIYNVREEIENQRKQRKR
jgi:hypothetical protein